MKYIQYILNGGALHWSDGLMANMMRVRTALENTVPRSADAELRAYGCTGYRKKIMRSCAIAKHPGGEISKKK